MTKIDGRTKKAAAQQLDESLKRLQTDHLDLVQHHENIRMEDATGFLPTAAPGRRSTKRRKREIRYMGLPDIKIRPASMDVRSCQAARFPFDTAQMPINVMDAHFRSFVQRWCRN